MLPPRRFRSDLVDPHGNCGEHDTRPVLSPRASLFDLGQWLERGEYPNGDCAFQFGVGDRGYYPATGQCDAALDGNVFWHPRRIVLFSLLGLGGTILFHPNRCQGSSGGVASARKYVLGRVQVGVTSRTIILVGWCSVRSYEIDRPNLLRPRKWRWWYVCVCSPVVPGTTSIEKH